MLISEDLTITTHTHTQRCTLIFCSHFLFTFSVIKKVNLQIKKAARRLENEGFARGEAREEKIAQTKGGSNFRSRHPADEKKQSADEGKKSFERENLSPLSIMVSSEAKKMQFIYNEISHFLHALFSEKRHANREPLEAGYRRHTR